MSVLSVVAYLGFEVFLFLAALATAGQNKVKPNATLRMGVTNWKI